MSKDKEPDTNKPLTEHEAKLSIIEIMLQAFCDRFLNLQAEEPLYTLWEAVQECQELNVFRGDPDTWAAAIAYAVARMNFLLDDEGPLHIERSAFFDLFEGCNRSTVAQKATRIEKTIEYYHGHPDFCLQEVVEAMPRFRQLSNGMIVPESVNLGKSADGRDIEISFMSEEESKELERQIVERKRAEEEEKTRLRHEELRKKREEERKTQPDLFDLGD